MFLVLMVHLSKPLDSGRSNLHTALSYTQPGHMVLQFVFMISNDGNQLGRKKKTSEAMAWS